MCTPGKRHLYMSQMTRMQANYPQLPDYQVDDLILNENENYLFFAQYFLFILYMYRSDKAKYSCIFISYCVLL